MGFFQQCFQLILQTDFVTRPLILCARECTPQALFGVRYKAQDQFLETNRFTKRSASRKSFLRPRRPRLDKACARCRLPDMWPASSRFSQIGFQYRSSTPHRGFQYCDVDSITTSSTACSSSQSESSCSCSALLPYQRRSNWYSSSTSTSATTTASFLL